MKAIFERSLETGQLPKDWTTLELILSSNKGDIKLGLPVFQLYSLVSAMPYTDFSSTVIISTSKSFSSWPVSSDLSKIVFITGMISFLSSFNTISFIVCVLY